MSNFANNQAERGTPNNPLGAVDPTVPVHVHVQSARTGTVYRFALIEEFDQLRAKCTMDDAVLLAKGRDWNALGQDIQDVLATWEVGP